MISKEENKLEKIIENNKDYKDNQIKNEKNESNNLIKQNLIKFLEIQLQESQEKILIEKRITEKEIMTVYARLNKEIEKSRKFSLEKLIIDFLPVVDNIERALNVVERNKTDENFLEILNKLKFIYNLLKEFLKSFNVKKIEDINVSFDPSIHQAMSIHYTNEMKSNKIVEIMQPGYILYELRLLRPAMVVVSKKKI